MKKSLGAKTILHPHPVLVVGTYDEEDKPNLMTVAWGGICCSKPPAVAISVREATKTYHNIRHHGAFTVNIPSFRHAREADFVGMVSGRNEEKFARTGLTAVKSALVHAPYVEEFPLVLECKVIQTNEIGLHTQFVGEILDVKADESVLGANGMPDILKVKPMLFATGNQAYYSVGEFLAKAFTVKDL
jgi:flavin reductase (DIM6/NTAB) family NADH-FMN oxidoreductase RutF